MKHLLSFLVLVVFITAIISIIKIYQAPLALSSRISESAKVSVGIGEPILALFGFTSPLARVELTGSPNIRMETTAREADGYFHFAGVFVNQQIKELCLTAFDSANRATLPQCISTPGINFRGTIGPVILPPSISLEKGSFLSGETILAGGQSLPNSQITISIYRADKTNFFDVVKTVLASELPKYSLQTDQNGNFSFNLPSNHNNTFRLLAQADYDNHSSPLSHKLTFRVYGWFEYLLERIKLFLGLGFKWITGLPVIETLILIEAVILLMLLFKRQNKNKSLMIVSPESDLDYLR